MRSSLITGVLGETLTEPEFEFFRAARPAGLILFSRNLSSPQQIRGLVDAVREAVGTGDLLVLIDQEGGRVQRLRPPLGRTLPPAASYGCLYDRDAALACEAAMKTARLVAADLRSLGINTNCAPVLDVPAPLAHEIIGDRAYGATPGQIADLGRAVAEGLMAGGVLPVMKHIPGHGRATEDSHLALPVVRATREEMRATDFATFSALNDLPAAMTAHVVFTDLDEAEPASTSATVTRDVIRNEIGFDGLLMSDDLSMNALSGSMRGRAERVVLAGSDIALHCNGNLREMEEAAAGVPPLRGRALERFNSCLAVLGRSGSFDEQEAERQLANVLALTPSATESV